MSRKRHYERFTNRALPPLHARTHRWFAAHNGNHEQNWEYMLKVIEQTRSSYMGALRANPAMDRFEGRFTATLSETDQRQYSAYELTEYIRAVQQTLKQPVIPDNPTPDQLQEALTQLSQALKPEPYHPQEQQQQDGGGEGDGDSDEQEGEQQEGEGGESGKDKSQKQPPPPKQQSKPPPKQQQGRKPKQDKQDKQSDKSQQQKQQQQQQGQQQNQQQQEGQESKREQQQSAAAREEEEEEEKEEEVQSPMHTGGGEQTYETPEDIAFWQCRASILNLCVARTPLERPDLGAEPYNLRRVAKSAYNPAMLSSIRDELGLTVDDVYLLLDTSGSVRAYAPLIASVAAAAAGIVHIYSGTEARPERKVERSSPLANAHAPFPEWEQQESLQSDGRLFRSFVDDYQGVVHRGLPASINDVSFEAEMAWFIEKEQPPKGSHIIIWTDTEGCVIHNPMALKALLVDYKVTLMVPNSRDDITDWYRSYSNDLKVTIPVDADPLSVMVEYGLEVTRNHYRFYKEVFKFLAIEVPVIFGVKDGPTFAQALRKL